MNTTEIDLRMEEPAWGELDDIRRLTTEAVAAALEVAGCGGDAAVSILLTNDDMLQSLNAQWRDRNAPTNILSFPAMAPPGEEGFLGDMALAYETMAREAKEAGMPLAEHYAHLVVHGVLHLLGFDHECDDEAITMEALEVRALASLGFADPYAMEVGRR